MTEPIEPEEILTDLLRLDPGLRRERFDELRPLLAESLGLVREKWKRRPA